MNDFDDLTDPMPQTRIGWTFGTAPKIDPSLYGTLVLVGMPPSGEKAELEVVDLADHAWRIIGSKMGSARLRVDIPKLVELYAQGRLKLDELISARYPLESINEAIASVKRGEALRNVIVF